MTKVIEVLFKILKSPIAKLVLGGLIDAYVKKNDNELTEDAAALAKKALNMID